MLRQPSQEAIFSIPLENKNLNDVLEQITLLSEEEQSVNIQVNHDIQDQIEELIHFASKSKHPINMEYSGSNEDLKHKIEGYNGRLKLAHLNAQQQDNIFDYDIDSQTNTLILHLKDGKIFSF